MINEVSFSHVANIIPKQTPKRTHDHETTGTVDPCFHRQQRRPARHAKRGLAHGGCQMSVLTKYSRFLPRKNTQAKTSCTAR